MLGETSAKINQDRGCIVYPFKPTDNGTYCKSQALFCLRRPRRQRRQGLALRDDEAAGVFGAVELPETDVSKAMKEAFLKTDDALRKDKTIDAELSGTTAVVILVRLMADGVIQHWTAWTGDLRAVIAHKNGGASTHRDLSDDQKPDTPAEQARITRAGGFVRTRGGVGGRPCGWTRR